MGAKNHAVATRPLLGQAPSVAISNDTLRVLCGGLIGFIDPIDDFADVITAVVLAMILGFQWPMICACIAEAIPGVAVIPTWTVFVLLVPSGGADKRPPLPDAEVNEKNVVP